MVARPIRWLMANDNRPFGFADGVTQDLRHAIRSLRSRPGFAFTAVLGLVLSVGANVVVFTLVNALWLRPRPVAEPDRVVMLLGSSDSGVSEGYYLGRLGFERLASLPVFEAVAGQVPTAGEMVGNQAHVTLPGGGDEIETAAVTREYFAVMGLTIHGRDFNVNDDRPGAEPVAIVSHRLWQTAFRGEQTVIGSLVLTSPSPLRVIGVAPDGFHGARLGERTDLWIPRWALPRLTKTGMGQPDPSLLAFGRLRPGVSLADAVRARAASHQAPVQERLIPINQLYGAPGAGTIVLHRELIVWLATATSLLVLLAGCATLMSLLLLEYERRRAELAIRLALGCSRLRLMRGFMVELGTLVICGSLGALAAAWGGLRALPAVSLPRGLDLARIDLHADWRVAAFGLLAAVATTIAAAMVPLRRAARATPQTDLVSSSARSTASSLSIRRTILAVHVASAVVVLVAAGLFIRTVVNGVTSGPGFESDRTNFAEVTVRPPWGGPMTEAERSEQMAHEVARVDRLFQRLRATAGVTHVSLGEAPLGLVQAAAATRSVPISVGELQREGRISFLATGSDYTDALGLRLVAGRSLRQADARPWGPGGEFPVLVTRSLAERLWPGQPPVGQEFVAFGQYRHRAVGVIEDVAFGSFFLNHRAGAIRVTDPTQALRSRRFAFVVRSEVDPALLTEEVRRAIAEAFPDSPRVSVATGSEIVTRDLGRERLGAWFFSTFGLIALVLGLGGVFGLVAYLAAARRIEMGVRLALGASPNQLARLVVMAGLAPVAAGTLGGLLAAALLTAAVDAFLIDVGRFDVLTYAGTACLVMMSAVAAGMAATMRLRNLSPLEALRAE